MKTGAASRDRFIAAGSAAFVYEGKSRRFDTSYWRAPDACLDDPAAMNAGCSLAWEAPGESGKAWRPPEAAAHLRPLENAGLGNDDIDLHVVRPGLDRVEASAFERDPDRQRPRHHAR